MRVAIVGPDASAKGGIATVIKNFKGITANTFIELFFFTTWREGNKGKHLLDSFYSVISFPFFLKKKNIDLVHLHVAQNGSFYRKSLLLMIAKLLKIPTVFHLHASQFDDFYNSQSVPMKHIITFVIECATGVVVLSDSWKEFYESIANIECEVIVNAVAIPKKNPYHNRKNQIVSFGRLGRRKGTFDLLKVATKIEKKYPDYQFILYGDGDIKKVKEEITRLELTNVRLGGWVTAEEKVQALHQSKMHVLASYQEGMPMAILETMAQGIPNISTKVGGIPQVIHSEKNGLLIDAGNTDQLEEAICRLIENDKLRQEISRSSFETIQINFSLEASYKKWLNYYKKIEGIK